MLESLDTVITLLKNTNPTSELDNIAKLAKAYHLLSDLESLQNPFIKLIKEKVNQQYEVIKNNNCEAFKPVLAISEEPTETKSALLLDLQQTIDQYNRNELRDDICRVIQEAQKPISIRDIQEGLSSKYGHQEGARILISQLSSQLGSWSWHSAHWWRPEYLSRAIYKAGNLCVAANAPNIDRSVFYVHWSAQGYVAKVRSYLANFKKNANHINGVEVKNLLSLAEVEMDDGHFTKLFNNTNSPFVIVDGAFYRRDVVVEFKVDFDSNTNLYSAKYNWGTPQHFETQNGPNLVTYLFSSFAFLSQQSHYQAAIITGDPQLMPADIAALIAGGIALKSKRSISKLPKV